MRTLKRYRSEEQAQTIILGPPGRKWTYGVVIDAPIRLRRYANEEVEKYTSELPDFPEKYNAKKAAKMYLMIGKNLGITNAAKNWLKEGIKNA